MTRRPDARRALPHHPEIERSLLGGLLLDPTQLRDVAESLAAADFHRPEHGRLFTLLTDLAHGGGYDIQVVLDRLGRVDASAFGGIAYVLELPNTCPSVESLGLYAARLRDASARRRLMVQAWETLDAAENPTISTDDLVADAERRLSGVASTTRTGAEWTHIAAIATNLGAELEERTIAHEAALKEGRGSVTGVTSGFRDLDRLTCGFQPGELVILAARPAMGKTALAMAFATAAARAGHPVGVVSLEMRKVQLVERMLASEALVDGTRLRSGDLDSSLHWPRIHTGLESIAALPICFDDEAGQTMATVRARAHRLKRERPNLGLLVIDYLQLVRGSTGDPREVVGQNSREMKVLAKELDIPILALAQLNRDLEKRHDKRPMMSDLAASGNIEQDADVIAFIYRDEVYNPDSQDRGTAEIILAKQRSGPTGTVKLAFTSQYVRFTARSEPYADASSIPM